MPKSGPIKWHGGKSYLAPKIIELMPPHTRYCEPFFGGGAVMLQKPCEGVAEYANDLNWKLTNFWTVLRRPDLFEQFTRLIEATPFSLTEWASGCEKITGDYAPAVKQAAFFFIRNRQSRQGLGRDFATPTSRLRRGMNEQVSAWLSAVDGLPEFHARLKRVEIRCQEATEFIKELDGPATVFYCDPPYLAETRFNGGGEYEHEMTLAQHQELLDVLRNIEGKFLLSGYKSTPYNDVAQAAGWNRHEFELPNQASGKKTKERKVECVWTNY